MRALAGAAVAVLLATASAASAGAQVADSASIDSLRRAWRLPEPAEPPSLFIRSAPAMGANSPIAFGAGFGDFYVGASFTARARFVNAVDGLVSGGFGLGDPMHYVGLQVDVLSFSSFRSGFGRRMGVDFKLHRVLPGMFAVALGWESAITRGQTDGGSSKYVVVSKWLPLAASDRESFSALMVSAGVGDGRFRREDDWNYDRRRVNAFGSVALRVLPPVSVIADWTGQDLTVGASFAPIPRWQIVVTPAFADVLGTAGDGARFVMSASWSFHL